MKFPQLSETRASFLSRISLRKFRDKNNLFMAQGYKCVKDLSDAYEPVDILITSEELPGGINFPDSIVSIISSQQMKKISTLNSAPEIIAIYRIPEKKYIKIEPSEYILFVDGVQDPGNLGTIIRTADWFGFRKMCISEDCADIYNPKTVQSTMGSLGKVIIERCNLIQKLETSSALNIIGTLLDGKDIFTTDIPASGIVIVGNEGNGISEELRNKITCPLLIPPYGKGKHAESLNVGVATGITLAEIRNSNKL